MQEVNSKFACKKGFRRAWVIMSIIWSALVMFLTTRFSSVDWLDVAMLIILPIAVLYLLGVAFVWVVEGFARADR